MTNYEGTYLGRVDLSTRHGLLRQLGLRAADEARRPEGDRRDRARARVRSELARLLLDRARRRGRQPARHGAGLRDVRQRRHARRRIADWATARGSSSASSSRTRRPVHRENQARRKVLDDRRGATCSRRSCRASCRSGTGKRAAIPDRADRRQDRHDRQLRRRVVRRATRRELVVAVWVGYPDELRPMLTEFGGKPVAGGTLPAQIWKAVHGARARRAQGRHGRSFPSTPYLPAQDKRIVWRGGWYSSTTATARARASSRTSPAARPPTQAECYAERGSRPARRRPRPSTPPARCSRLQPLGSRADRRPGQGGQRPGLVIKQEPRAAASSRPSDTVRLWVTRPDPRYGLFPNLVGSSLDDARARLKTLKASTTHHLRRRAARRGPAQSPQPGVAAGTGHEVTLVVVAAGQPARVPARRSATRRSAAFVMPIRVACSIVDGVRRGGRARTAAASTEAPSCAPVIAERLREPARARAEQRRRVTPRRARIAVQPVRRLERAQQHRRADAVRVADDVHAPVDAVRAVDVQRARAART